MKKISVLILCMCMLLAFESEVRKAGASAPTDFAIALRELNEQIKAIKESGDPAMLGLLPQLEAAKTQLEAMSGGSASPLGMTPPQKAIPPQGATPSGGKATPPQPGVPIVLMNDAIPGHIKAIMPGELMGGTYTDTRQGRITESIYIKIDL